MKSFQDIASNSQISDNEYVFVKHGRAQVEGRLAHKFTSIDRNAKSVRLLMQELRGRYGSQFSRGAFFADLYQFSGGGKQLKVGDLRRFFQTGEIVRLNKVATAIREACGPDYADALRPLADHIRANHVVTDADIHAAVTRRFGDKVASAVTAGRSGDYLDSLPELFSNAREMCVRLNGLPPRVQDAVVDFCRGGKMTQESLVEVLEARLAPVVGQWASLVETKLADLPEDGLTLEQAIDVCKTADFCRNRSIITQLCREIGDEDVCSFIGLNKLYASGAVLTNGMRRRFIEQAEPLKPKAAQIRSAIREVFREAAGERAQPSNDFEDFSQRLASSYIQAGRFADADLAAFKDEIRTRALRETNYDYAIDYELNRVERLPAWTKEQKAQFRSTMDWLRAEFPNEQLFFRNNCAASLVAKFVSGEASASPSSSAHPLIFLKAATIMDDLLASFVLEKTEMLAAKFPDGNFHVADVCRVFYGDNARVPDASKGMAAVQFGLGNLHDELIWERIKAAFPAAADAVKRAKDKLVGEGKTKAQAQELADQSERSKSENQLISSFITKAQFGGFSLDAAVAHVIDKTRSVHLEDFSVKPQVSRMGMNTPAEAELQWLKDFERQGETGGADRNKVGLSSIEVKLPERTVRVHNGSEGLADGEAAVFESGKPVGKTRAMLEALRELCGENETLYTVVVAALTQSGIVAYAKATSGVVEGADGLEEHAPLAYVIEKDKDGSVVIEAKTPAARKTAVLEARVVIRPDGSHEFTKLDITPLGEAAKAPQAPAQAPAPAAPKA